MVEEKKPQIIGMVDLHDRPEEIRRLLHEGETLLLTKRAKAFAHITPLAGKKGESAPKGSKIMGLSEVREDRDEFIFTLLGDTKITLTYYGRPIGVVNPKIPAEVLEQFPDLKVARRRKS